MDIRRLGSWPARWEHSDQREVGVPDRSWLLWLGEYGPESQVRRVREADSARLSRLVFWAGLNPWSEQ